MKLFTFFASVFTIRTSMKLCLLACYLVFLSAKGSAQCSQTGYSMPGNSFNQNSTGAFSFSNASALTASDDSHATATATLALLGGSTDLLKINNLGFNIPIGSTICGIEVSVEKYASGINVLAYVNDDRVRLMKNNVSQGANRAKPGTWASTDAWHVYGGSTDLWGTTWTPAEINDPNFGTALSAEITGVLSLLPSAHYDAAMMTVYYQQITLPVKLVNFKGQYTSPADVKLSWATTGSDDNTVFTIQRSQDGSTWADVAVILADASSAEANYSYTDKTTAGKKYYYRLAIRNNTGFTTYSDLVTLASSQSTAKLTIYPNPAADFITVETSEKITSLQVVDAVGNVHRVSSQPVSETIQRININSLARGIYYVQVNGSTSRFIKK